jgi:hypothetical protein
LWPHKFAKKNCRIHELLSFVFTLYTVYMHILHVPVLNILTTTVQDNRRQMLFQSDKTNYQINASHRGGNSVTLVSYRNIIHSEKKVLCTKIHIPLLFHDHTVYVIADDVQYQVISHSQC